MLKLTSRDRQRLKGVHADILKVIDKYLEIGTIPIIIVEGVRTLATQKKYVARGASTTLRSRHLTGHAVDIAPRDTPMSHWPPYYKIAEDMKKAARAVGVPLEWGGDWKRLKDGPHWQLPWAKYPAKMPAEAQRATSRTPDTEGASAVRKASMFGVGGFSGSGVALGDTMTTISDALSGQQYELTSGDIIRITLAGVIIVTTLAGLWMTYRSYKDSQEAPEVG